MPLDLILKGGRVVDPSQKLDRITDVAFSGAVAKSGVAHSGQNTWARRLPLCATLTQLLGVPRSTNVSTDAATTARKGAPDRT